MVKSQSTSKLKSEGKKPGFESKSLAICLQHEVARTDHVGLTFSFYQQQCVGNSLEPPVGCKILLQNWGKC